MIRQGAWRRLNVILNMALFFTMLLAATIVVVGGGRQRRRGSGLR